MLELFLSPQAWLSAAFIFALRVSDMSLDTLRVLFVMRGKKQIAWVLGFFQSAIFVLAIGKVLSQVNNPLNIIGYAAGFATGNVVGMIIEEKIAIGHILISVISPRRGSAIVSHLRKNGYAVTELSGRGKDGMVTLLNCSVLRKQVDAVHQLVNEVDPEAFITAEDVRPVRRGFWRA
jgi:uncharacterized protein YebE (UPF0316 family)